MGSEFNLNRLYHCKRVSTFLLDETMLQIGSEAAWLRVAVGPNPRSLHLKT